MATEGANRRFQKLPDLERVLWYTFGTPRSPNQTKRDQTRQKTNLGADRELIVSFWSRLVSFGLAWNARNGLENRRPFTRSKGSNPFPSASFDVLSGDDSRLVVHSLSNSGRPRNGVKSQYSRTWRKRMGSRLLTPWTSGGHGPAQAGGRSSRRQPSAGRAASSSSNQLTTKLTLSFSSVALGPGASS